MAFSKKLAKYIGNEVVGAGAKSLTNFGARSTLGGLLPKVSNRIGESLLKNIIVKQVPSKVSSYVPVVVNGKVNLKNLPGYSTGNSLDLRHISRKNNAGELGVSATGNQHEGAFFTNAKGSRIPVVHGDNVFFGNLDNVDVLDITDPDTGLALSKGYGYNLRKSDAFNDSANPAAEISNQISQIQRGITGSINHGDILDNLTGGDMVIKGRSDVRTEKAPEFILTNNDMVKKAGFNMGYNRGVAKGSVSTPKYGLDEYGMGTIDLRHLNEPKVSQSIDDSMIPIYHGTNATFEDFDDRLPSVWFSDSDKHLEETGMQGSDVRKKINVVKRKLPRDLKLADEDLADNLTKQQLIDRGYAGVYYPNSGPNGDETYYEIFRPYFNEALEKMPKVQQSLDDMVTIYHNTKAENIPSILEQGLVPGKRAEGYLASPEEAGIWTDDRGLTSGSYGGTTVKIRVPRKEFDATRVNDTQNLLNRVIKPSEIEGVDYMLYDAPLIKNSNLQEFIDKYGEDKVRSLIEKKGLVSPDVIEEAFSGLGGSAPKVSQSLGYGGYGSYDENVKRVGSSAVAPVREETLPDGWKELEKYLDTSNDRLSLAIGKPRSKITKQDLINFLEDYGYDTEGTKDDLWKNALMCIDDMALEDLYNAGGSAGMFLQNRLPFRHNDKLTDVTNYYIGAKGRTGRLDAEFSDRLGIGRSNTPMSDRLVNPYSGAGGDYSQGAFGTNATWATGESGVSTAAHERMHAWQDINKFDWDEEVVDAIDELRGELKKFYHDEDTIKKYWGNSKTDYYMEDIEQEARMLQSYLDNEGYTNTYRKTSEKGTEWGNEIKPAFDKFFEKFRDLSKRGKALPAIAGLFGLGAMAGNKDDKKLDNIE